MPAKQIALTKWGKSQETPNIENTRDHNPKVQLQCMRMCYATLHLKFNGTFLGRKILLNKDKEKNEKKETEKNESLTTKTETTIMQESWG